MQTWSMSSDDKEVTFRNYFFRHFSQNPEQPTLDEQCDLFYLYGYIRKGMDPNDIGINLTKSTTTHSENVKRVLEKLKSLLVGKINKRLNVKEMRRQEHGFFKEFGIQGMILAADFSHLRLWIDDIPYTLFLATDAYGKIYFIDLIEGQLLDGKFNQGIKFKKTHLYSILL